MIGSLVCFSNTFTLACAPRSIFSVVSPPKKRWTMLSQEPGVRVKCRGKRGWRTSQCLISGVLWVA